MRKFFRTVARLVCVFIIFFPIVYIPPSVVTAQVEDRKAKLTLLSSNDTGIVLDLAVPGYSVTPISNSGEIFDQIGIPGSEMTSESGKAQMPMVSTLIGLPPDSQVRIHVLIDEQQSVEGRFNLNPVAAPAPAQGDMQAGELNYRKDPTFYASGELYPSTVAQVSSDAWVRNQRIARIELYPMQYSPLKGGLIFHKHLRIYVEFIRSAGDTNKTRVLDLPASNNSAGNPFEPLLQKDIINYSSALSWQSRLPVSEARSSSMGWLQPGIPAYKIVIASDGIYRLTYAQLQAAGVDVTHVDPALFHLSNQGDAVAYALENDNGDHVFNPNESVLFFGQKFYGDRLAQKYAAESSNYLIFPAQLPDGSMTFWHSQFNAKMLEKYTDENVYWLEVSATSGLRMSTRDGTPHDTAQVPTTYTTTVHAEQSNQWYTHNFSSEDTWYWDSIRDTSLKTFTTTLSALASSPYLATVRGEFVARASSIGNNPDHHTKLWINNQAAPFKDVLWDGISRYHFEVKIPQSQLTEGVNSLRYQLLMDAYQGQSTDWQYFDWFEISYLRQFLATNDQILFSRSEVGQAWQYQLTNFSSPSALVLDITDPLIPKQVLNPRMTTGTLEFESNRPGLTRYIIEGSSSIRSVKSISSYLPPDFGSSSYQADYVFITHHDFLTATQTLANYRATQGLRTKVINVDDIYNQFNFGIYHPIAIKNFIAFTFAHWSVPPTYVLLVGDGHWNFKGYPGYNNPPIYMPPNLSWVDPWQGEVDSTNLLAAVVGNDPLPDVLIGRLPVNNTNELNDVITKIINYEQSLPADWQRHILSIAENVPDPAGDFMAMSDGIIRDYIKPGYSALRIYENNYKCSAYPCPWVNSAIINTINITGTVLVNYVGHASLNRWSNEQIFTNANIASLTNSSQLPVIFSLTCLDGYWIHPGTTGVPSPGLIEELVRAANKGAVSAFSPNGLGVATGHDSLERGFYDALMNNGIWNLGQASQSARLRLYAAGANLDLINTYMITGDPALRIKSPYKLDLFASPGFTQSGAPGAGVNYALHVVNSALITDTFHITVSNNTWPVSIQTSTGPMASNSVLNIPLTVSIPFYAGNGLQDGARVTVTSTGDINKYRSITLTTTAIRGANFSLIYIPQIVK